MRLDVRTRSSLAVAFLLAMVFLLGAQSAQASAVEQIAPCTPGVKSYVGNGVIPQSGSPYSATLLVTFDRRLGDGSRIHGVTRTFNARASSGKARMETSVGCGHGKDGRPFDRLIVRVADPWAGTFLDWTTGGSTRKVATLLHQPEAFPKDKEAHDWRISEDVLAVPGQPTRVRKIESLGSKSIDGLLVEGQRITITTPVGEEGNAAPIVETHDRWMSKGLGVVVADLVDDPERGRTEMVLENLNLGEPDPALFAPPEGYAIKQGEAKAARQ